ncbi:MAG: hypothetical protein AB1420_05535 [Bacillota bacterium]
MEKAKRVFWDTLKLFQDNGLLQNLIVVGSWAEFRGYSNVYYQGKSDGEKFNINRIEDNSEEVSQLTS